MKARKIRMIDSTVYSDLNYRRHILLFRQNYGNQALNHPDHRKEYMHNMVLFASELPPQDREMLRTVLDYVEESR